MVVLVVLVGVHARSCLSLSSPARAASWDRRLSAPARLARGLICPSLFCASATAVCDRPVHRLHTVFPWVDSAGLGCGGVRKRVVTNTNAASTPYLPPRHVLRAQGLLGTEHPFSKLHWLRDSSPHSTKWSRGRWPPIGWRERYECTMASPPHSSVWPRSPIPPHSRAVRATCHLHASLCLELPHRTSATWGSR